jgi:hypothetical protein
MSTSQEHELGGINVGYENSAWFRADVSEWVGARALTLVDWNH